MVEDVFCYYTFLFGFWNILNILATSLSLNFFCWMIWHILYYNLYHLTFNRKTWVCKLRSSSRQEILFVQSWGPYLVMLRSYSWLYTQGSLLMALGQPYGILGVSPECYRIKPPSQIKTKQENKNPSSPNVKSLHGKKCVALQISWTQCMHIVKQSFGLSKLWR